ncbi:MAG: hypothetical protein H6806_11660 [Planctomycetes bacterium]|nr:hypothetical protein [Planctomycetota bacterium]MCB9830399.1 hypothetical protein [Planctomycetota bacterium]MCB9901356.1 hypothetical protein [Planctomycetota bacterium]
MDDARSTWRSLVLPLAGLLVLVLLAAGLPAGLGAPGASPALAGPDDDDADEDGKEGDDEPPPDLGEKDVPFIEKVNEAIEKGTNWLLARGKIFEIPGARDEAQGAHYGFIQSKTLYGGGTGPGYPHPAGPTALALYTLLKCDVEPSHGVIERGFTWLKVRHRITQEWDMQGEFDPFTWTHTEAGSSYEISAMILALTAKYDQKKHTGTSRKKLRIRDKDDQEWLVELVEGLVDRRGSPDKDSPPADRLGWRYNMPRIQLGGGGGGRGRSVAGKTRSVNVPPHANQDLSSTQLAALALYNAHRFGVDVDPQIWLDIAEFTLSHQEETGPDHERHDPGLARGGYAAPKDKARGFMYIKGSPDRSEGKATGSMTACGIANLLMCQEVLANHRKTKRTFGTSPLAAQMEKAVWDGLAWLDRNWSSFDNRNSGTGYHTYYLYALERTMDMLGKQLVGKRLWYQEGAEQLLKRIQRTSSQVPDKKMRTEAMDTMFWETKSTHEPYDVLDTCFALLFLKRATRGVMPPPAAVTGN